MIPTTNPAPTMTPARPVNHPKFDVRPYQPDGGFTASGLVTMLGAMLAGGAAVGFAAHYVANFFYLIILFPVLIGVALGALGARLVKFANLRNPLLGGVAGFVGGAAAMTMMHWFDYNAFRDGQRAALEANPELSDVRAATPEQRAEILAAEDPADRADVGAFLDAIAVNGFVEFMDYSARQGVEIKKAVSGSGKGLNLGYVGTYVYWGVELLIVAGMTFLAVRRQAGEPFCAECALWKPFRRLGAFGGAAEAALAGVTGGDVGALASAAPGAVDSPLELHVAECGNCRRAPAAVKLELLTANKDGNVVRKVVAQSHWPAESVAALDALFAPAPHTAKAA